MYNCRGWCHLHLAQIGLKPATHSNTSIRLGLEVHEFKLSHLGLMPNVIPEATHTVRSMATGSKTSTLSLSLSPPLPHTLNVENVLASLAHATLCSSASLPCRAACPAPLCSSLFCLPVASHTLRPSHCGTHTHAHNVDTELILFTLLPLAALCASASLPCRAAEPARLWPHAPARPADLHTHPSPLQVSALRDAVQLHRQPR